MSSSSDTEAPVTLTLLRKRSSKRNIEITEDVSEVPLRKTSSGTIPLRKSSSGLRQLTSLLSEEPTQFVEPSIWANLQLMPGCQQGTDALGSYLLIKKQSQSSIHEVKVYSL